MSIILEVNHPAQVHLFKHAYVQLKEKGHKVCVMTKKNPSIEYLLRKYLIPYEIVGVKGDGLFRKVLYQVLHDLKALGVVYRRGIKLGIGSSITNDHVSAVSKLNSVHFSDDDEEMVPFIKKYSYPFSDTILSPDSLCFPSFEDKHIGYAGTHELSYLHPNWFKPDPSILKMVGLEDGESYFVLRFVALKGHHDGGHLGVSLIQKRLLIDYLKDKGRIFITSESPIEDEFEQYRLPVSPEHIHSLMYYAKMFIGDSQTMTSEAAIMGVPSMKCNTFAGKLSVPNELEDKYGLCFSYQPSNFDHFFTHIKDLLNDPDLKSKWLNKKEIFLNDKIDVTAFFVWFIENYPESKQIMKDNPDYQYRFK